MPDSTYFARPEIRLAIFLENLRARNRPVKTASIDFTDTPALIRISIATPSASSLGTSGGNYDLVLLTSDGLEGFSLVREWHDFEGHSVDYSEEDVIAEYIEDLDIDKV